MSYIVKQKKALSDLLISINPKRSESLLTNKEFSKITEEAEYSEVSSSPKIINSVIKDFIYDNSALSMEIAETEQELMKINDSVNRKNEEINSIIEMLKKTSDIQHTLLNKDYDNHENVVKGSGYKAGDFSISDNFEIKLNGTESRIPITASINSGNGISGGNKYIYSNVSTDKLNIQDNDNLSLITDSSSNSFEYSRFYFNLTKDIVSDKPSFVNLTDDDLNLNIDIISGGEGFNKLILNKNKNTIIKSILYYDNGFYKLEDSDFSIMSLSTSVQEIKLKKNFSAIRIKLVNKETEKNEKIGYTINGKNIVMPNSNRKVIKIKAEAYSEEIRKGVHSISFSNFNFTNNDIECLSIFGDIQSDENTFVDLIIDVNGTSIPVGLANNDMSNGYKIISCNKTSASSSFFVDESIKDVKVTINVVNNSEQFFLKINKLYIAYKNKL